MSAPFRREEDTMTVKQIWEELDKKVSVRKIYLLIESGDLSPAFRFAGKRGTCVPKPVVLEYKKRCVIDASI